MTFFITVAIGIALAIAIGKAGQVAKVYPAWAAMAQQAGLSITPKSTFSMPRITGAIDGIGVAVTIRRGGDNEPDHTRHQVTHIAYGPPVSISRQFPLSRVASFFGRADVELGDPFFDDRVVIDTHYDNEIRDFLTPARQAAVLQLFDRYKNCKMTQDTIIAETKGIEYDRAALAGTIRRLVDIAKVMSHPQAVEAALVQQHEGNIADAAAALHTANESEPNLFVETLEAEALIELGDHEHAAQLFESVDQQLTDASPTDGWERLAAAPAPASLPAPPLVPGVSVTQQDVIDDLFSGSLLSYQIVERFENNYARVSVTWNGTVTGLNSFRHDSDFGQGPGQKAVVHLGGAGNSSLISNEVHAVVQFPEDDELRRGQDVVFTGTLVRIDRFARKFYVANARAESR